MTYRAGSFANNSYNFDETALRRYNLGIGRHKELLWYANGAIGTALSAYGSPAPTATGTATFVNDNTGSYINYLSAASTNALAGIVAASPPIQQQGRPIFTAAIKTGAAADILNMRIWVGIFTSSPTGTDTPANPHAGFVWSTNIGGGGGFWRKSGSSGTTATSVAFAADTRYEFRIDMLDDSTGSAVCHMYINDVYVGEGSFSGLVTSTMLPVACLTTLNTTAKNFKFGSLQVIYP